MYYSRAWFQEELQKLRPGLTPETATEREFMAALEKTNYTLRKWDNYKNSHPSQQYRDPQSFLHKDNPARPTKGRKLFKHP